MALMENLNIIMLAIIVIEQNNGVVWLVVLNVMMNI